jgi:hypothetical protein
MPERSNGRSTTYGTWVVPVSGIAGILVIAASVITSGDTPGADAPVGDLVAFYAKHHAGQVASGALSSLGALLLLVFMVGLARRLRGDGADSGTDPAVLGLCGGVVLVVGLAIFAGLSVALGDVAEHVDPATLQALHVLSQEMVFPVTVGTSAFLLGSGVAALRSGGLPRWVGWMALVLGALAAVPSHVFGGVVDHIGFAAFIGLGVWTLIASVLLAGGPEDIVTRAPAHTPG